MTAVATRPVVSEPHTVKRGRDYSVAAATGVVIASWLPVLVGATTRTIVGWGLAVVLAVVVERLTHRMRPVVLVTGFFVSSAFVASGIVSDPTHYMPVAVTGGALALRFALDLRTSWTLNLVTPQPVLIAVGAYIAWAALTTLTSIDHRVSLQYLAGMVAVCGLAFWAIPVMIDNERDRDFFMGGTGVLGVLVAISVYVIALTSSVTVFSRAIGDVQLADLTVGGRSTGLLFLRSAGIYLAPLEAAITMALATGLLLGLSLRRNGRSLLTIRLAIAFMVPAILLTLDRTSWLAVIAASGAFAILAWFARLPARTAVTVFAFYATVFVAVFVGALGANAVATKCTVNCSQASGGDETTLRGGTGLSGREYLWKASILAIEKHPILGVGPGNNVPALDPYLGGARQLIQSLTSHSTWLRTGVEMGIPGFLLLLAVLAAVGWTAVVSWTARSRPPDPANLALVATVFGLLPAATFESFLLGGVTFSSLFLTGGLGLIAVPAGTTGRNAVAEAPVER